MGERRLGPEERALWERVAATVTPLPGRRAKISPSDHPDENRDPRLRLKPTKARAAPPPDPRKDDRKVATRAPADTLDGGWDKRLRRGIVLPDRAIDLHGHTLASAHAALDEALAHALADDLRVLLVVTGKPPRPGQHGRGLIRASIGDWLQHSRHASRIAAVRNAHPRHGGAGALYLILRRRRGE